MNSIIIDCEIYNNYAKHLRLGEIPCDDCKRKEANRKRAWKEQNRDKVLANKKRYRQKNPDKIRATSRRRRARRRNNGFEFYTEAQVIEIYGSNCHICSQPIDLLAPRSARKSNWQQGLHIDHVIPIAKNGNDTLENVRPAHGICNLRKGAI